METLLQVHSCFFPHSMKQRLLGGRAPPIFRKSSHFSLWEAVSPKIYCWSPKIKHLALPNFLVPQKLWTGYATESLYCCITCQRCV